MVSEKRMKLLNPKGFRPWESASWDDIDLNQKGKMQVTIKDVSVEWVGSGAKKYGKAAVKFNRDGRDGTQYLVSFKNPDVFKKVQEMVGQTVEVESKKDGDFWQWVSINAASGAPSGASSSAPSAGTTRVSGSNYETKEERAARQVLIVKQSSLSNAVAVLSVGAKAAPKKDEVLALAQEFLDWVLDVKAPSKGSNISDMDDDIPF